MSKVLLIEDEPLTIKIYRTHLQSEGQEVLIADNGEEGLKLAVGEQPDLIVLDIMMPKIDGFSLLKEIKSNPKTQKIPIIIYSNLSSQEDISKAKELGATDYLIKAKVTPTQVVNKIKEFLPRSAGPKPV